MSWFGKSLLALTFSINAYAMPYNDQDFDCTTSEKASQYTRDFSINVRSFGGLELCDSKVDTKKLFNDLSLIELGEFAGTDANVFVLNKVDRENYYAWLRSQTRGVRRGNDMPTATAYNSGGYFTMQDGWAKLSTLGRVGTIVHEARHTEGYGHNYCDHGPYENIRSPGCDDTVSEGGAHGVEMEYYSRVALQGKNFHPVYQTMARLMTTARSNFVFNEDPMGKVEGLVAKSNQQLVTLFNDQITEIKVPTQIEEGAKLKRTSFGINLLVPGKNSLAVDLQMKDHESAVEDQYSYFKLQSILPIQDVLDMEEVDLGTKRYFVAVDKDGNLYNYNFAEGEWNSPVPSSRVVGFKTRSPHGDHGLYAITSSGDYCQLRPETMTCTGALSPWPKDNEQFVKYGPKQLVLTNGKVFELDGMLPFAPLTNFAVEQLVEAPMYNVF